MYQFYESVRNWFAKMLPEEAEEKFELQWALVDEELSKCMIVQDETPQPSYGEGLIAVKEEVCALF